MTDIGGNVVVTRTGTVTAGEFQGDTVVRVMTFPAINPLDCLGSGLTSQLGVVVLSITAP